MSYKAILVALWDNTGSHVLLMPDWVKSRPMTSDSPSLVSLPRFFSAYYQLLEIQLK